MIFERILKMAKAEQTKRTLASAMKKLLAQMPYEKVSVSMIAEEAGMNRKSFYYHFTGKSDLINWILDTEFREYLETTPEEEQGWEVMEMLASYFYRERLFYKTILLSTGYATLMLVRSTGHCQVPGTQIIWGASPWPGAVISVFALPSSSITLTLNPPMF